MLINNVIFNCELMDILIELQRQLSINGIQLLTKMRDSGGDVMVQCPYHANGQERRPSAGIRKSDGQFHCLACQETHSLAEVISFCFGYTEDIVGAFGWKWLLQNFATLQIEERKDVELDFGRQTNNKVSEVKYVTEEELDKYRYYHPYWTKRGITDEKILELFDLGFDPSDDCITFPNRDINGNCLFVAKRSVKTKYFHYPKDVEKPIYGLYEYMQCLKKASNTMIIGGRGNGKTEYLRRLNELIITESMLDALSFWQIGRYAVALNGLGSESQFRQLREAPCRKFILATDSDKAGMKARQNIRDNVKNKLITEYIFPEGKKDANECTSEELQNLQEVF